MAHKKPRSDAKLLNIAEADQRSIYDRLRMGMSYAAAKPWIAEEFSVSVSSDATLSAFWEYWCEKDSEERILRAVSASDAILEDTAGVLPRLDAAMESRLKQLSFEAMLSGDVDNIKHLVGMVLKFKSAEQDDRKIALQERRLRQAQEAEAVVKTADLSPEQRDAKLKEIFGL